MARLFDLFGQGAIVPLSLAPIAELTILCSLMIVGGTILMLMLRRRRDRRQQSEAAAAAAQAAAAVVVIKRDREVVYLSRRLVPQLRAHRPPVVVEAQQRWRRRATAGHWRRVS